jgi:hypothetical protein
MTDLVALLAAVTADGWWIPAERYAELYGESVDAVKTRKSKGIWRDGVECSTLKGGGLWVNLIAVNAWAARRESRRESRSVKPRESVPPASA